MFMKNRDEYRIDAERKAKDELKRIKEKNSPLQSYYRQSPSPPRKKRS